MLLLDIQINTIYTLSILLYLAILAKYFVFTGILIIILARTLCSSTPPRLLTQSLSNFHMWSGLHRASAVWFLEIVAVTT